ncbi:MAG: glycosyl hydrolase family 28-related protein [Actinomyces sp.]|jgi:alpha-1,3-glucanase (fragment)|uniref:glycosyl hydrolase family 28-related protein n=1 Tax=Isoptericola variabilis TaxID=139208 RepID=UPI00066035AB|nr:glycosyl hydrolase family 28-related protein [Isoptericola variabilis]MBS6967762.1 right-handed parallel beta-helix repeat-containing protein [Actinomyces sp.]MDU5164017.1 glycosyl hydrolase family 28-related protein [Actinomyces sp.]
MKRGPFIAGAALLGVVALVPALVPSAVAADDQYGASVPYTRYEAEEASRSDGTTLERSDDLESTAIEASGQSYVALNNKNSSVDFTATAAANALDLRFTLPDHTSGRVDVRVNNETVATLDLSSESAWQYVGGSSVYDESGAGLRARFRFDEVHTLLGRQVQKGDHIQIVKVGDDQNSYGIDFIELEQAAPAIERPEGAVSIADYNNARPGDGVADDAALAAAMDAAANTASKTVYIPAGTWEFSGKIGISHPGLTFQGAGLWYTNIFFTSDQAKGGGIVFNHGASNETLTDFAMSSNLKSRYNQEAQYKGFSGEAGDDTRVANVWVEHFECGFWMGDYVDASQMLYTNGMVIENARIRNNLADGVNFAQGTKDSTVRNSSVRGNGDDGLASWSSIDTYSHSEARIAEGNSFIGNTVELGWRASGIGIFGGKSHVIKDNLIVNNFSGAGIRLNTVFDGHNFDLNTDQGITIAHNKLVRSGTTDDFYGKTRGAIDFQEAKGEIRNVTVSDNLIVRPYAEEIRADFGLGQDALSARGITLRDNKRDDEAMDTAQAKVVNYVLVGDQVVRTVPESENYSLYWYQRDERGNDGTINRYWVSKADGLTITPDMEYSVEGGKRVYNVTLGDLPEYLPVSTTDFSGSYNYVADLERSQPADDGTTIVVRFWSAK